MFRIQCASRLSSPCFRLQGGFGIRRLVLLSPQQQIRPSEYCNNGGVGSTAKRFLRSSEQATGGKQKASLRRVTSQKRLLWGGGGLLIVGVGAAALLASATTVEQGAGPFWSTVDTDKDETPQDRARWSEHKLPQVAQKTHKALNDYLSIVAYDEILDSLERIEHLLAMDTQQRKATARKEYQAIQQQKDVLSERNYVWLQQHFLYQQVLLQLLTCQVRQTTGRNACAEAVGRTLNPVELEVAREEARAELEHRKSVEQAKRGLSSE